MPSQHSVLSWDQINVIENASEKLTEMRNNTKINVAEGILKRGKTQTAVWSSEEEEELLRLLNAKKTVSAITGLIKKGNVPVERKIIELGWEVWRGGEKNGRFEKLDGVKEYGTRPRRSVTGR
jgi:hypothetical protein